MRRTINDAGDNSSPNNRRIATSSTRLLVGVGAADSATACGETFKEGWDPRLNVSATARPGI